MTDITDQDRRTAIDVAEAIERGDYPMANMWPILARVILATVDAPAPTLAEELARIAENSPVWTIQNVCDELKSAAARAEQMEHDLAEARAEVKRLAAENEQLRRTDNFRDFKAFLGVQKDAESNAEGTAEAPDPADVKPEEAWLVSCAGGEPCPGFRGGDGQGLPWVMSHDDMVTRTSDKHITLVSRLVPAPRVITNPDDLDTVANGSILRNEDRSAYQRDLINRWRTIGKRGLLQTEDIARRLPLTVLWEPEA